MLLVKDSSFSFWHLHTGKKRSAFLKPLKPLLVSISELDGPRIQLGIKQLSYVTKTKQRQDKASSVEIAVPQRAPSEKLALTRICGGMRS